PWSVAGCRNWPPSRGLILGSAQGCYYGRAPLGTSRSVRTFHPRGLPASSVAQGSGKSGGGSVSANHAPTAASRYSNTDTPRCVQVAITVQIRSHQRSGFTHQIKKAECFG